MHRESVLRYLSAQDQVHVPRCVSSHPIYASRDPDPGAFLVDSDCTLTPLPVLADYPLRRLNQHVNTPRD